jgi:hypothetical protein
MTDTADPVIVDPAKQTFQPLFQVSPTLPESVDFDVKPVRIAFDVPPAAFPARLGGFADPGQSPYAKRKGAFDSAARGFGGTADRIWFFRGSNYIRYFEHPERKDDASDWLPVQGNWPGLPSSFSARVDAVLTGNVPPYEGQVWLFSGDQYLRYDPNNNQVTVPARPIAGNWNLPDDFAGGFDAAIHGVGDYLGISWFFKGGNYVRYNVRTDQTEFGPADITSKWGGWPGSFADGVDFAFYGTGPHQDHIYFFRGDQYIRYNLPADRVEEGPANAIDAWPVLGRFMPVPQLFLTEKYKLFTFHGEIGNGGMVGTETIEGLTKKEVWVVTKRRQASSDSTSTNILESSSQQVVDNFSDTLRVDSTGSESHDDYDYGMDASFHGDAEATGLTGGEVNADLHVKGATHDVRTSFAKAVGNQVSKAKQDSQQLHSQQVSMQDISHQIDEQTETGFRQVVDNTLHAQPVTFAVYQLTQEYILVLSLVDAQLVFRNGDDRAAASSSVRDMGRLLEECVEDAAVRADVARAVVTALSSVTDSTTGATRSLLAAGASPDSAEGAAVDPSVRTTFAVNNTEGKLVRTVDVDGIVISVERPVVLTPNTALGTLEGSV